MARRMDESAQHQRPLLTKTARDPGETLVSATVKDPVAGAGLRFEDRGTCAATGSRKAVPLYAAFAG
jgi:hypothetical protein